MLVADRQAGPQARLALLCDPAVCDALAAAEKEFDAPLLSRAAHGNSLTPQGEQVLAWADSVTQEYETLNHDLQLSKKERAVAPLLGRRSVSPKRLCEPGPVPEDVELMLLAALRAPDHGGLHPWRVLEFKPAQRPALAQCFEQEKRRRDPLASEADLRLAREHATRAPHLMAFIVSPRARKKVPVREQWLAAGAALSNLLGAAHQLGFGAIMLSGERCFDQDLLTQLGIASDEFLAGFISMGTVAEAPPPKAHALPGEVWSAWRPAGDLPPQPGLFVQSTASEAAVTSPRLHTQKEQP
ncbi:MAG: nitroreductase [Comamonadaceae bacterium]|nr:MAG: nitroreductase [Comamonadaceae bacterium]